MNMSAVDRAAGPPQGANSAPTGAAQRRQPQSWESTCQ